MGVELHSKRTKSRFCQLRCQSSLLRLTLAHFAVVSERINAPQHCEIQKNTQRKACQKRGQEITKERHLARTSTECCRQQRTGERPTQSQDQCAPHMNPERVGNSSPSQRKAKSE